MGFVFKPIKKVVDKVVDIVEDTGDFIEDEIIDPITDILDDAADWVVDEIVDPVVDMGQSILEAAGEDPLKTIATIAAIATQQYWMIPLIDGAAVLADGGDIEDAAKAAAISYVATTVGATAGTYASAAASTAGTSTVVANVIGAGTKSATTALVYGQDPLDAFLVGGVNAFVATSLGKVSETMTEKFGESFEDLNDGVKDSIYAGISAEVSGGALSPEQLSNVIMKNAAIGGTMSKFLQENAGFDAAQAAILTNAVSSAVTKTILGNPDAAGEAFFDSISAAGAEALKVVIDKPVNASIDKISGAYKTSEEKALALDAKTTAYNKVVNDISVTENAHNELLDELNGKIEEQDKRKKYYNQQKVLFEDLQKNTDVYNPDQKAKLEIYQKRVNAAAEAYNTWKDDLATDYNTSYKPALDAYTKKHAEYTAQLPDVKTEVETANSEYETALKFMNTKVEDFDVALKPAVAAVNKSIALSLRNDFDEDAYKAYHGLDADADVYGHFLEQGQNLPTDLNSINKVMDEMHLKTMQHTLAGIGIDYRDLTAGQFKEVMAKVKKEIKNPASLTSLDFKAFGDDLDNIIEFSESSESSIQPHKKADGVTPEDIVNGNAVLGYDSADSEELKWQLKSKVNEPITVLGGIDSGKTITSDTVNDAFMENLPEKYLDKASVTLDELGNVLTYTNKDGKLGIVIRPDSYYTSLPDMIKEKQEAGEAIPPSYMSMVVNLGEEAGKLLDEYVGTPFYESAKTLYDTLVSEGAKDVIENTASVIGGATGETLKALSGLAVIVGANPNNSLGKFADNLISASGDLRSESYASAIGEIDSAIGDYDKQWREDNPGQELSTAKKVLLKAKAIYGAAWENPIEFLSEYVVKEIIQEVPLLLVSGGVGNLAKKGLLEAGEAYAKKIATQTKLGTAFSLDAVEAFGGTAAGAFDEAYATAIKTGMSEQEATDYAIDIAQTAGTTAIVVMTATAGLGGQALAKSVLGDKVDDVATGAFDALFKKIKTGGTVMVKEGVTETIEEGLPQLITGMSLAMIDPTYDVAGNVTGAAILGKIAGAGTAGGIYTGNAVADALMSVNSNVINAVGNASDSTAAAAALADIGITDNVILNNILNTSYDTQYVSTAEAAKAFENQNPDYVPTEDEIESFVSNRPDSEVATLVAGYIDKRYLDVDEVKAAAEASGITLTDEQAEKFVGQNPDETEALNAAIEEIQDKSLFYTDADGNNVFAGYYPNMGSETLPVKDKPDDKPSSGEVPDGITPPPAGSANSAVVVEYVNEITGETYSAPSGGYTPVEGSGWVVKPPASETLPMPTRPIPDDGVSELIPAEPVDDSLTADDVQDIIDTAIGNLPESATPEDVSDTISDALAGMNNLSDADVTAAIENALADMNNLSTEDVQEIVDDATEENAEAISDLETNLTGDISDLETDLTTLIEANNGDVTTALDELANNLNTTEENILAELNTTEAELVDKFETGISEVEGSISELETSLTALIEANDGDVTTALDELANNLGTTEENILAELDTTEANLIDKFETEISGVEGTLGELSNNLAALGIDVDTVADLIGKPAREVTETDVDFVIDLIAQENVNEELTMQYDVTGDGIVDINDQNMLMDNLQGNDVAFADTSMFNPATGLYLQQEQDTQATMDAITDLNTTITTNIDEENKRKEIAEAEDVLNQMSAMQQVSVKTPDPMNINYLYDFNSIFANPSQEGLFGSPYGTNRQPANTPMQPLNRASGFAEGGQVEDENDRLLRLLGDLK